MRAAAIVDLPPHHVLHETGALDIPDDRSSVNAGDCVVLIVDNDENFARFLLDMAHEYGMKGIATPRGADAVSLARERAPDAMTLDINLPDIDGWRVLERLKSDLKTRHIPVYVITTEEESSRAYQLGAVGVLHKPIQNKETLDRTFAFLKDVVEHPRRRVLVAGREGKARDRALELVSFPGAEPQLASLEEVAATLEKGGFGCLVLALDGPELRASAALESALATAAAQGLPAVLYASASLGKREEAALERLGAASGAKTARSPERLVDAAALALHLQVSELSAEQRTAVQRLHETDAALEGKKVLIVDDDIRNIFALTSVLERHRMEVVAAETGREAIRRLETIPNVDIVLMDIMMPDMDGYDTMRAIRKIPRFKALPIIAVTAKAMKGDREKTLEAGAWDYLAKPVDADHMLSVLRAWLYR